MSAPSRKNVRFSGRRAEAREVRAARVDLGLGEVGVDGERAQQIRAETLRGVEARLERPVDTRVRRGDAAAGCHRGPGGQPDAQIEVRQTREFSGMAGLRHLVVAAPARPAIDFLEPLDAALDVEVPGREARAEGERRHGDANLERPAPGVPAGGRFPEAVPVGVLGLAARIDERVVAGAARVDREDVARPTVPERVEDDLHVVLVLERRVAGLGERHDAGGSGILAANADDDGLAAGQHADDGAAGGGRAGRRFAHGEVVDERCLLPGGLAEPAVETESSRRGRRPPPTRARQQPAGPAPGRRRTASVRQRSSPRASRS